jgi:hypothetical protein
MHLEITSTSHNRVDWVVRTKVIWMEIGLVSGVFITAVLLASTASPIRWRVITILISVSALIAGILAATTPVNEHGFLERLPDGGELILQKFWIPIGPREAVTIPVEEISGFKFEASIFQDSAEDRYPMARLWIIRKEDGPVKLTAWLEPESVNELGDALAKACRCEYDQEAFKTIAGLS